MSVQKEFYHRDKNHRAIRRKKNRINTMGFARTIAAKGRGTMKKNYRARSVRSGSCRREAAIVLILFLRAPIEKKLIFLLLFLFLVCFLFSCSFLIVIFSILYSWTLFIFAHTSDVAFSFTQRTRSCNFSIERIFK